MGIYKVKDKCYIDFYADGRRIRKSVGSEKDAENALAAVKTDILRGELRFKKESKIRFEDFAKEYFEYSKVNKKSWERDRTSLKALTEFFDNILLSKITAGYIEKYKTKRIGEVSSASINRELACLSAMFSLAKKSKFVDENPVREVSKFQERKLELRILSKEEIADLIEKSSGHLRKIIILALNTAMRRGEIFALKWKDVDFEKGFIYIAVTKSGVMRKIPMNSLVIEALKNMKRENEFVFFNSKTEKSLTTVRRAFKTACQKADINSLRFHDLRHTAATYMVMGGIDLVTVSEILGHSDIKMTMRYAHPTPENRRKAVDVLAVAFGQEIEKMVINRSQGENETHFKKDLTSLNSNN